MTTTDVTIRLRGETSVLGPDQSLTFGRTVEAASGGEGGGSTPHLALADDPALHARAGVLRAVGDGWVLENTGRWLHLRLLEVGGGGRAEVAPGRSLRVPWRRCRVEIATGNQVVGFEVETAAEPADGSGGPDLPAVAGDTEQGLALDRGTGYFRALVALCEPQLSRPGTTAVATAAEIARTLNRLDDEPERVTAKAVERRLAHVRQRVGIGGDDPHGVSAAGLEVRDAAHQLVDLALRTGTVTAADLSLITAPDGREGE